MVAIRHLFLNPGQADEAFVAAQDVVAGANEPEASEVLTWLEDAKSGRLPASHPLAGFVKIAFTHAFHHLRQATPYEDALIEVLGCGGDTDTNACIFGGLSGALHGFNDLPHEMVQALVNCNTSWVDLARNGSRQMI